MLYIPLPGQPGGGGGDFPTEESSFTNGMVRIYFFVQNLDFLYTIRCGSVGVAGRILFETWRDRKAAGGDFGSVQRFRGAFLFGLRLGCEGVKLLSEAHRETEKSNDSRQRIFHPQIGMETPPGCSKPRFASIDWQIRQG